MWEYELPLRFTTCLPSWHLLLPRMNLPCQSSCFWRFGLFPSSDSGTPLALTRWSVLSSLAEKTCSCDATDITYGREGEGWNRREMTHLTLYSRITLRGIPHLQRSREGRQFANIIDSTYWNASCISYDVCDGPFVSVPFYIVEQMSNSLFDSVSHLRRCSRAHATLA